MKTPLFDAMVALAEEKKVSFHTPGHKSGKGISTRFKKFVGPKIFSIDLTTLDEVDSLQRPRSVIKYAQELAAKAYGADRSYFLVNGTTGGNHAMLLASCRPGDKILVARNIHKSVVAGLILSGADPIFFSPSVDDDLKIVLNVSSEKVKDVIDKHPDARAIFITSPNYYGICADNLPEIISYASKRGLITLVDEAHGPHLKFHPDLPVSALESGADLCVQSTHKIIGGMTQASILHAKAGRIDFTTLSRVLRFIQTTSPSYILMASLDLARMQMATEGKKLLDRAIRLADNARTGINKIKGLSCPGRELDWELDVTKLTITVKDIGISGYEVAKILNREYNIQVEMADPFHILVIVSIGDRRDDLIHLVSALKDIADKYYAKAKSLILDHILIIPEQEQLLSPREAFFSGHEYVELEKGVNRVNSDIITVYPPGIAILIPGEIIYKEIIEYIKKVLQLGAIVDGLDERNNFIGVVKER
ncbi:MAG: aminotransferase class I/II-fold pyridoxal phosphate-dependent enzyme [Nitrospirota bacterium]